MPDKDKFSVIERGLEDSEDDILRGMTVKKGYEKELARLFLREVEHGARKLFVSELSDLYEVCPEDIADRMQKLAASGASGARLAKYITELYVGKFGTVDTEEIFATEQEDDTVDGEISASGNLNVKKFWTVAFVSGESADTAYRCFAEKPDITEKFRPVRVQRLSFACDSVVGGEADGVIIPIRNSVDGRLRSFYRMIDSYGLKIVSVCSVETSSENEDTEMRYALCMRSYRQFSPSPEFIEISLPATGEDVILIAEAAKELGWRTQEITSRPSERNGYNIYSFTFSSLSGMNCMPLILYMNIYHPGYTFIGLYDIINGQKT